MQSYHGKWTVGEDAINSLTKLCICPKTNHHGANCEIPDTEETDYSCGEFGTVNRTNTISGCSCKKEKFATPYHGWYCNVANSVICKADDEFYVHDETEIVADPNLCLKCSNFKATTAGFRCAECKQHVEFGNF